MRRLKCPFGDGPEATVTAANASPMSDGAAALVLASRWAIKEYNLTPLAKIIACADASTDPLHFTVAPAAAIKKALHSCGRTLTQVDVFEINEAFASVALANIKLLDLDIKKVNVWGGAISIGHPLGA